MAPKKKKTGGPLKRPKTNFDGPVKLAGYHSAKIKKTPRSAKKTQKKKHLDVSGGAETMSAPANPPAPKAPMHPTDASDASAAKSQEHPAGALTARAEQTRRTLSAIMLAEVDRTEPFATDELHKAFNLMEEAIQAWGAPEQKALENLGLHHNLHENLKQNVLCKSHSQSSQILRASKVCEALSQIQDAIKRIYRGQHQPRASLSQSVLGPFMDLFSFVANPSAFDGVDVSAHKKKLKYLVALLGVRAALENLRAYHENRLRRAQWF